MSGALWRGMLRHPLATARVLRRHGATLAGAVALAAILTPERVALVRDGATITCHELAVAVQRERVRREQRDPAGTRIGVRSDDGIHTIVLAAAAIGAGLDVVMLGPRLAEADVVRIIARERLVAVLRARDLAFEMAGVAGMARVADATEVPPSTRRPGRLGLLTTGTSGIPRAHARGSVSRRVLRSLRDLDRRIGWPPGPVLVLAPVDHGHGLSAVLSALLGGRTAVLAAGRTPAALAADIAAWPPASMTGVPLRLNAMIESGLLDDAPLARIVSGSSRLDDALAARLAERSGASVIDCLGTTETGTFAVREGAGVFRAIAGMRVRIDDQGMLMVRSPFAAKPLRTGDTARRVGGGFVLGGRADGLVDSAGELLAPERVREAILAMPGVRDCVVRTDADELRGSVLIVSVEVDDPDLAAPGALRERLLPSLGRAGVPQRIDVSLVPPAGRD